MGTLETSQSSAATKRTANREKPAPRAAGDSGAGLRALISHPPQRGWNENGPRLSSLTPDGRK